MAYSEPLDIATPGDNDPISQGDNTIRQFKRAVIERLSTLVEDIAADPWVLKEGAVSESFSDIILYQRGQTGIIKYIPAGAGVMSALSDRLTSTGGNYMDRHGSWFLTPVRARVDYNTRLTLNYDSGLPPGSIVRMVRVQCERQTADAIISLEVYSVVDGVAITIADVVSSELTMHWLSTGTIAIEVPENGFVSIGLDVGGSVGPTPPFGSATCYVLEVTFDMPPIPEEEE